MRAQRLFAAALACIGLSAGVAGAAPTLVTFENDGDLGLFTQQRESTQTTTLPMWAQDPAAGPFNGVNGSRGLTTTGTGTANDSTLVYTGPDAVQNVGFTNTVTLSTMFRRGANSAAGVYAQLGLLGDNATNYGFYGNPTSGTPTINFISLRLRGTETGAGTTATDRLELQTRNFPSGPSTSTVDTNGAATGTDFTLAEGNWYEYILTFEKTQTNNQFAWTAQLLDRGVNGTDPGTPVFPAGTLSGTLTAPNIYADDSLYAGLRSAARTHGLAAMDNFAISATVPEPATLAAAMLAGAGLASRRRRRRA